MDWKENEIISTAAAAHVSDASHAGMQSMAARPWERAIGD